MIEAKSFAHQRFGERASGIEDFDTLVGPIKRA